MRPPPPRPNSRCVCPHTQRELGRGGVEDTTCPKSGRCATNTTLGTREGDLGDLEYYSFAFPVLEKLVGGDVRPRAAVLVHRVRCVCRCLPRGRRNGSGKTKRYSMSGFEKPPTNITGKILLHSYTGKILQLQEFDPK